MFFVYAVGLVLGIHFDHAEAPAKAIPDDEGDEGDADPSHPLRSGFRAMLLPFVVSPLAVAADLEVSLFASDWGARWVVAGAFALVALVDALCAVVFAPVLRRTHESILEVLSRLLGILLAAVGVQLFLHGLDDPSASPSKPRTELQVRHARVPAAGEAQHRLAGSNRRMPARARRSHPLPRGAKPRTGGSGGRPPV